MFYFSKVIHLQFVCLFVCIDFPVNNFSVMSGRSHRFLGFNQYSRELMCLAQVTLVGIEHRTSRFDVRRSTTRPPRSLHLQFGNSSTCPTPTRAYVSKYH